MDWMDVDSSKWTKRMIENFIYDQNNAGERPRKHSAEKLIQFAGITDPKQIKKFNKIYEAEYA